MSTPITDAAWQDFVGNALAHQSLVQPMRRLELDRAALMECCRDFCSKVERGEAKSSRSYAKIMAALSTARANFP